MKQLQDKLNAETKPKRESSFHAGSSRKAKEKCLEGLRSRPPRSSSSGTNGKPKRRERGGSSHKTSAPAAVKSNDKKSVSIYLLFIKLSCADHSSNCYEIFSRALLRKMIAQIPISKHLCLKSSTIKRKVFILIHLILITTSLLLLWPKNLVK